MKNIALLFEYNKSEDASKKKYKKQLRLVTKGKNKYWQYVNEDNVFSGDSILKLIDCLTYLIDTDKFCLPIEIKLNQVAFNDKLVFIILECICFYMICHGRRTVAVSCDPKKSIWTDGIRFSPLKYLGLDNRYFISKFYHDNQPKHFREIIDYENSRTTTLSKVSEKIYTFLLNLNLEFDTIEILCESIVEIIGNSFEHGHSDCLVDIDITEDEYKKIDDTSDALYYGINVVVLSFSDTSFYKKLKYKMMNSDVLNDRYDRIKGALNNHFPFFNSQYTEDDFYTVASFQHKISGSFQKKTNGGVGLTQLIKSLEDKSSGHLCYLMSEKRVLYFHKDFLQYNSDDYIGFNKENDFFEHIPDESVFANSDTHLPGTAYNLNFAIMKGDVKYGE